MHLKIITFILTILTSICFAAEVEVDLNPRHPVKGEAFDLIFKVKSKSMMSAEVMFDQKGLDVLGVETFQAGLKTLFVAGRMITVREDHITYKMFAAQPGSFRIKNIVIEVGQEITRVDDVKIVVSRLPSQPKDIIVRAELSKNAVFVGEPIRVDYVLYNRIQLTARDIKQFPKLKGFIKRFIEPQKTVERVSINNELYEKYAMYSVMLFPEKTGELKIDPIQIRAQHITVASSSITSKSVSSETEKINIKALPSPMPKDFTGLIGKHKFSISSSKSNYLVNEAITIKLEVSGSGVLENYDGPKLYQNSNLEEFEISNELNILKNTSATKVFEYTYLGRAEVNIPETKISVSCFDPEISQYVRSELVIPQLRVVKGDGQIVKSNERQVEPKEQAKKGDNDVVPQNKGSGIIAPLFSLSAVGYEWVWMFNISLGMVLLLIVVIMIGKRFLNRSNDNQEWDVIDQIQKAGLTYSRLHHFVLRLDDDDKRIYSKNLNQIIDGTDLSEDAKRYFYSLIDLCNQAQFQRDERVVDFIFEEKYFKEAHQLIKVKS